MQGEAEIKGRKNTRIESGGLRAQESVRGGSTFLSPSLNCAFTCCVSKEIAVTKAIKTDYLSEEGSTNSRFVRNVLSFALTIMLCAPALAGRIHCGFSS